MNEVKEDKKQEACEVIEKCWIKAVEIPSTKEMRYLPAIYLFIPSVSIREVIVIEVENVFKANRMIRDQQGNQCRPKIFKSEAHLTLVSSK